jgi:hypothetical protein
VRYEFLLGYVADLCGEWFLVKEYDGAIFLRTAGPISMNITNEVDLGCYLKGKTPAPVFKMPEGQLMNESKAPPSFPAKERMSWWKIWK